MSITIELLQFLVLPMLGAAATWGAIRTDIKHLVHRTTAAENRADHAHQRLDQHLEKHHA